LKGENKKKESGDDEKGSKDSPRESQKEGLHHLPLISIVLLFFLV